MTFFIIHLHAVKESLLCAQTVGNQLFPSHCVIGVDQHQLARKYHYQSFEKKEVLLFDRVKNVPN
jgi:hypothetical protein